MKLLASICFLWVLFSVPEPTNEIFGILDVQAVSIDTVVTILYELTKDICAYSSELIDAMYLPHTLDFVVRNDLEDKNLVLVKVYQPEKGIDLLTGKEFNPNTHPTRFGRGFIEPNIDVEQILESYGGLDVVWIYHITGSDDFLHILADVTDNPNVFVSGVTKVEDVRKSIIDTFTDPFKIFSSLLLSVLGNNEVTEDLIDIFNDLIGGGGLLPGISPVSVDPKEIMGIFEELNSLTDMTKIVDGIGGIEDLLGPVKGIGDTVGDLGSNLGDMGAALDEIQGAVKAVQDVLGGAFEDFSEGAKEAAKEAEKVAKDAGKEVKKAAEKTKKEATKAIKGVKKQLDKVKNEGKKVIKKIKKQLDKVNKEAKKIIKKTKNVFKDAKKKVEKTVKKLKFWDDDWEDYDLAFGEDDDHQSLTEEFKKFESILLGLTDLLKIDISPVLASTRFFGTTTLAIGIFQDSKDHSEELDCSVSVSKDGSKADFVMNNIIRPICTLPGDIQHEEWGLKNKDMEGYGFQVNYVVEKPFNLIPQSNVQLTVTVYEAMGEGQKESSILVKDKTIQKTPISFLGG